MRSFLVEKRLVIALGTLLIVLGLAAVVRDRSLRRAAEVPAATSETFQTQLLALLELGRTVQDFPQAIGTGSEETTRGRLGAALDQFERLPAELAQQAARARATGNAVLTETLQRTRAQIEVDLLTLVSAVDRMTRQDQPGAAAAHSRQITDLLIRRLLPELIRPQRVLETQLILLHQHRWSALSYAFALAVATTLALAVMLIAPLSRSERQARTALDRATLNNPVTGLPNQNATERFLESLPPGQAVLITAFEIAPAFGLPDGDQTEITIGVAGTIGNRLRDLGMDVLYLGHARPGRYCIVQPAIEDDQDGFSQLRDLESLADEPVQLGHRRVRLIFRAGVAVRRPNRPARVALENAGIALDKARELRALQPVGYRPEFRREMIADRRVAQELRVALMSGEVLPYFQPQIDLRTGAVTGMEALARWHHPRRGLLPPGAFLPQAQRTGLDEPLGEVMMRMGLGALRAWDERGLQVGTVGINAAASQLSNPRFFEMVRWELDRQHIAPERLAIEVLESIYAPSDDDPIARNLRKLAKLGVRIDMDDFGTGATSVMGMRRYHATRIKIDRSFIRDIDKTAAKQMMVSTMVQMAHNLEIDSLAEGVETGAERAWLAHVGCDHIQGFGVARPMPLDDTFAWLAHYRTRLPRVSGGKG